MYLLGWNPSPPAHILPCSADPSLGHLWHLGPHASPTEQQHADRETEMPSGAPHAGRPGAEKK